MHPVLKSWLWSAKLALIAILLVFALWNFSKVPVYYQYTPMTSLTYNKTLCEDPNLHPYVPSFDLSDFLTEEQVVDNMTFRPHGCSGMQTQWNLKVWTGRTSPLKLFSDVDNFLIPHTVMGVILEILLTLGMLQGRRGLFDRSKFFFPLAFVFAVHIWPVADGIPDSLAGGAPINETLVILILCMVAVGAGGMFMMLQEDWSWPHMGARANNLIVIAWISIGLLINLAPLGEFILLATGGQASELAEDHPHPMSGQDWYAGLKCPWIGRIAGLGLAFSCFMYGFEIYAHARGEPWRTPFSRDGPAMWQILSEPAPGTDEKLYLRPEIWLEATGECFVLCMAVSWFVTAVFNPHIFQSNILRGIVGYNNLCVGFDSAPARYFAMPLLVLQACFAARYSFLDTIRLNGTRNKLSHAQYYFAYIANWVFAVHMVCFPMLLVILADFASWKTTEVHLYLFMFTLFIMWMMIAGNVFEASHIELDSKIWFSLFTAHTLLLPVVGVLDVNAFWGKYHWALSSTATDKDRKILMHSEPDPPVPWWLTAYLDYGWFLLLLMTVLFLPKAPPVRAIFRCSIEESDSEDDCEAESLCTSTSSDVIGKPVE